MSTWFARCSVVIAGLALFLSWPASAHGDLIIVEVHSDFFLPREVSVSAGDTVCWMFMDGVHTTTSFAGLWDSGIQVPGSMFEVEFDSVGDFMYFCSLHFQCCDMQGVVHVLQPVELVGALAPADIDPDAAAAVSFEMRPNRSALAIMVENVSSTQSVDAFVNGNFIGTITLDANGNGELSLNSANGDTVPELQNGDEIEIFDAVDDTTLILIGNVQPPG